MQPSTLILILLAISSVYFPVKVKSDLVAHVLQSYPTDWEEVEDHMSQRPQLSASPNSDEVQKANLVRFFLYTDPRSQFRPEEIIYGNLQSLVSSKINKNYPTKIFIHGFGHNSNCSFPQAIKDTYISEGYNINIIAVDWGLLSSDSSKPDPVVALRNYKIAVDNVPIVGRRVGDFISFLYQNRATTLSKVHVVGFSLGAHVAGYAGQEVFRSWFDKIGRITGLDPAGPLFMTGKVGRSLTFMDANFVDFMHTDMGQCGIVKSMGHVNFYVNSGFPPQPGCIANVLRSSFLQAIPLALSGTCSHNTAPIYFNMSILRNPYPMKAQKCLGYIVYRSGLCFFTSTVNFGDKCSTDARGDFFIDVKPSPPSDNRYTC